MIAHTPSEQVGRSADVYKDNECHKHKEHWQSISLESNMGEFTEQPIKYHTIIKMRVALLNHQQSFDFMSMTI